MPTSCLYRCIITHARQKPVKMFFKAKTYMLFIDLAQKESIAKKVFGLAINRYSLHTLSDKDHFLFKPKSERNMLNNFAQYLEQNNITLSNPRYFILTNLSVLGYVFNPVSFYFVYDDDKLKCVVSEVNNTYGEQKLFLHKSTSNPIEHAQQKMFYVSPFISHEATFHFEISEPADEFRVRIYSTENNLIALDAVMVAKKTELTTFNLLWLAFTMPFLTLKIIVLIHYYAFRLFIRKVPYFGKKETDSRIENAVLKGEKT